MPFASGRAGLAVHVACWTVCSWGWPLVARRPRSARTAGAGRFLPGRGRVLRSATSTCSWPCSSSSGCAARRRLFAVGAAIKIVAGARPPLSRVRAALPRGGASPPRSGSRCSSSASPLNPDAWRVYLDFVLSVDRLAAVRRSCAVPLAGPGRGRASRSRSSPGGLPRRIGRPAAGRRRHAGPAVAVVHRTEPAGRDRAARRGGSRAGASGRTPTTATAPSCGLSATVRRVRRTWIVACAIAIRRAPAVGLVEPARERAVGRHQDYPDRVVIEPRPGIGRHGLEPRLLRDRRPPPSCRRPRPRGRSTR